MKKLMSIALALALALSLAACGGSGSQEAPDLQAYYDNFMTSLGDEAPMMMEITDEFLDTTYPGLSDCALRQRVLYAAAISAVAFELALVEVEDAADAETVREIFQARIDSQVSGGAMYPATVEAWENGEIITGGNVVALIVGGEYQAELVEGLNEALLG